MAEYYSLVWASIILFIYCPINLDGVQFWGHRPQFPSNKIPDDALSPDRAVVRKKIVLYHNFFRMKVEPPATNMLYMSWHPGAAKQAQRYADQCVFLQHNSPLENTIPRLGSCGQNLFVSGQKTPCAHQKFKALAPEKVGHNKNAKLPMVKVLQYPELRVNPFRDRICKVFSASKDGDCTFEDFLDMMSVFSENAPKAVKAEHAFRIFDFDGDDMIGVSDLREVIERLCGSDLKLTDSEIQLLVQNVLEEADLDDDGALSFAEFEHIIDKSSDFCQFFAIKTWFLEYQYFTYGNPILDLKSIGHYTQMVWATSFKVGCGVSLCQGGPWGQFYNYVCHYCPGGNYDTITQFPYKAGKSCSDCPEECVSDKLCKNSCPTRDEFNNCHELASVPGVCEQGVCNATCVCGTRRIHRNYPF